MTNANEKIQIEMPEIDFSNIKVPDSVFADTLKSLQPTPAEMLGSAVGTLAGGAAGYIIGKSLGAGFWGKAFFTLAGSGVGSAVVGYATSKLGKDTV